MKLKFCQSCNWLSPYSNFSLRFTLEINDMAGYAFLTSIVVVFFLDDVWRRTSLLAWEIWPRLEFYKVLEQTSAKHDDITVTLTWDQQTIIKDITDSFYFVFQQVLAITKRKYVLLFSLVLTLYEINYKYSHKQRYTVDWIPKNRSVGQMTKCTYQFSNKLRKVNAQVIRFSDFFSWSFDTFFILNLTFFNWINLLSL